MDRLPRLIDTPAALTTMLRELQGASLLAVDTESNGFHAYRPKVCLIQLADRSREWIVDPGAFDDLSGLAALLTAPHILKLVHAAEGDIRAMRRDLGFGIHPLFDTMVAARVLAYKRVGLADLLGEHFNVQLDKRFQRHDWGQRPIPPPALRYAAADVRHLPALYDRLRAQLAEADSLQEAEEEFDRITRLESEQRAFDPDGFWRVKGARDLPPPVRAVLKELYIFRDGRARAQDRPPVKVLGDDLLLTLSQQRPAGLAALRLAGLSPLQVDRYGNALVAAVQRGLQQPPPELPRPSAPPADPRIAVRYDALRAWRRDRAAARGVESDVIVSNTALRALSHATPATVAEVARVAELGPWKTAAYAAELLEVLRGTG